MVQIHARSFILSGCSQAVWRVSWGHEAGGSTPSTRTIGKRFPTGHPLSVESWRSADVPVRKEHVTFRKCVGVSFAPWRPGIEAKEYMQHG